MGGSASREGYGLRPMHHGMVKTHADFTYTALMRQMLKSVIGNETPKALLSYQRNIEAADAVNKFLPHTPALDALPQKPAPPAESENTAPIEATRKDPVGDLLDTDTEKAPDTLFN